MMPEGQMISEKLKMNIEETEDQHPSFDHNE
jgi:hypothetical protein